MFVGYKLDEFGLYFNFLELVELFKFFNVDVVVFFYEEIVEWVGVLNLIYCDDFCVFNWAFFFWNKVMMKCKVLLGGLKVGLFEEVYDREYVYKFFDCFNEVEL